MAESAAAELEDGPGLYQSSRDVNDVLVSEDVARPLIKASSCGDDAALRILLSRSQWIATMLEKPRCIYYASRPSQGPEDVREVSAMRTSNVERCLFAAAINDQAAVISTILAFASRQGLDLSDVVTRPIIFRTILYGHTAVFKALAVAYPAVVTSRAGYATLPLYEAVAMGHYDMVATLLQLGADPLHPVEQQKRLSSFNSSLLAKAAKAENSDMVELLLKHDVPIAQSGALHTAAAFGTLDVMQFLLQHGADVNEHLPAPDWSRSIRRVLLCCMEEIQERRITRSMGG